MALSLGSLHNSFYVPSSATSLWTLDRAATLSQDVQQVESILAQDSPESRLAARRLYEDGAYCQSYASLQLVSPLTVSLPHGTKISSANAGIKGVLQQDTAAGEDLVQVMYVHDNDQSDMDWSRVVTSTEGGLCSVGGNPNPQLENCFDASGHLIIPGLFDGEDDPISMDYTQYDVLQDTRNALSLAHTSLQLDENAPSTSRTATLSTLLDSYQSYFGSLEYANDWVIAAFDAKLSVSGRLNFAQMSSEGVNQCISLGGLIMNVWMHTLVTFDQALEATDCQQAVSLWDEGVAFYGGIGGPADGSLSQLLGLAEEYCQWFGTCSSISDGTTMANVNVALSQVFQRGQSLLTDSSCNPGDDDSDSLLQDIATQMTIPLIQGILYHAYEMDVRKQQGMNDVSHAKLVTFAAALLPRISTCDSGNADLIALNTLQSIDNDDAEKVSFHVIKGALERQYECLGITCDQVGGIVDIAQPGYYSRGASPCGGDFPEVASAVVSSSPSCPNNLDMVTDAIDKTIEPSTSRRPTAKVFAGLATSLVLLAILSFLTRYCYDRIRTAKCTVVVDGKSCCVDGKECDSKTAAVDDFQDDEIQLDAEIL